ncbi:hypothetical protein F5B21DRAFT_499691 [Xylaria acuta]|nr:hypothetical protein F5B21DRAFT_499691 [Xylaria acuta]
MSNLEKLMTKVRDDMLPREASAIEVSDPVLEDYGQVADPNHSVVEAIRSPEATNTQAQ